MDISRHNISHFTIKLQSQIKIPLWSIANEKMIYAAAVGETPEWGPRLRLLHRIMRIAYKIKISDFLIFSVGMYRTVSIWLVVKKKLFKSIKHMKYKRVFAGFGASSEDYLYDDYVKQSQDQSLRINWVTHEGLHELGCPSLMAILFVLVRNSFGYTTKLNYAIPEISCNAESFLTVCAFNIGSYAFYRSYWKMVKSYGVAEVTFLVVDIPCFASIDENLKTIYLQHGLMAFSILIPMLKTIEVLTVQEEDYLKRSLKNIKIVRKNKKAITDHSKNNILMILSLNVFQEERLSVCKPLLEWAVKNRFKIVVRPTKSVNEAELTILRNRLPNALLDDLTITLDKSFEKWRPKLVSAWTSTGLATALDYGILPIILYDPNIKEIWNNMIYPMRYKVLFWPRDKPIIDSSIQSEKTYYSQLETLRSYQDRYTD